MTGQAFLLTTFGLLLCFILGFKVQNPCSSVCFDNMVNYSSYPPDYKPLPPKKNKEKFTAWKTEAGFKEQVCVSNKSYFLLYLFSQNTKITVQTSQLKCLHYSTCVLVVESGMVLYCFWFMVIAFSVSGRMCEVHSLTLHNNS